MFWSGRVSYFLFPLYACGDANRYPLRIPSSDSVTAASFDPAFVFIASLLVSVEAPWRVVGL